MYCHADDFAEDLQSTDYCAGAWVVLMCKTPLVEEFRLVVITVEKTTVLNRRDSVPSDAPASFL